MARAGRAGEWLLPEPGKEVEEAAAGLRSAGLFT